MYSTYNGAKKRAKALQASLQRLDLPVSLSQCQHAMARGGNYRDWDHLRRALREGSPPPLLEGFQERARVAVPAMATGPANRWLDGELSRLEDKAAGGQTLPDETRDWYLYVYEYASAVAVQHRVSTPLLKGGRGMHMRQSLIQAFTLGILEPRFDPKTFVLTSRGTMQEIFRDYVGQPGFEKALRQLVEAGIFEVLSEVGGEWTIALHPPSKVLVQRHVDLCRRLDAEYYENAV